MKYTDFAKSLSDFLSTYLVNECGYSMNTVKAYATTFSLFVVFFSEIKRKKINSIILDLTISRKYGNKIPKRLYINTFG